MQEATFEGRVRLTLLSEGDTERPQIKHTDFALYVSDNMQRDAYIIGNGIPTENGSKVLTALFIQGLVGNIHLAHQKGWRDSAEHLRHIISELERGFVENVKIKENDL